MVDEELCIVCTDMLDGYNQASCQMCGGRFHQHWSVGADVPSCGRITSHEEALAIVFLCLDCYDRLEGDNNLGSTYTFQ